MNRISALLQKLQDLARTAHPKTAIDADLMLDYTRVLYADLLELRKTLPDARPAGLPPFEEPTLAELSESLEREPEMTAPPVAMPVRKPVPVPVQQQPVVPAPPPVKAPPVQPAPAAAAVSPTPAPAAGIRADLRRHIGINDKYRFISELFGNDVGSYERAMDALNAMHSKAEASHWMRENLWIREDADAEEVLDAFRAAVSQHFEES